MLNVETSEDGIGKYVVNLKGPYDGCRFETISYPNQELVAEIVDMETETPLCAMKLKVEVIREVGALKSLRIFPLEEWPKKIVDRGELLQLSAWYLAQTYIPRVWIEDDQLYDATDLEAKLPEVVGLMLGESPMDSYFEGYEVYLHDGLVLEESSIITPQNNIWVMTTIRNADKYVGWLDGRVYEDDNKELVFETANWVSSWEDDDLKHDLLAIHKRYLANRFGKVKIVNKEMEVEMDETEVAERSFYWLRF